MKGYIPVEIPTKRYIRAYIISQLGDKPFMNTDNPIGCKLHDLLQHQLNERKLEFSNKRYDAKVRIYISAHTFRHRGANLNETNIKNFNNFIEAEIKSRFRFLMDLFIDILPNFEAHLPAVRKHLGIDDDHWSDDSMRKDYYRYRKNEGKSLLYTKKYPPSVTSDKNAGAAF
jgi:hypothetical protein